MGANLANRGPLATLRKCLLAGRARAVLAGAVTKTGKFHVVLVTAPDLKTARQLARAALQARLAACANLLPKVESHYWWHGKIERGAEVLLVFKTTSARLAALEKLISSLHPYDTPEFVTLPLAGGNRRYLVWLAENCTRN
jgi:periplasmic divalent cation tolerance protein